MACVAVHPSAPGHLWSTHDDTQVIDNVKALHHNTPLEGRQRGRLQFNRVGLVVEHRSRLKTLDIAAVAQLGLTVAPNDGVVEGRLLPRGELLGICLPQERRDECNVM